MTWYEKARRFTFPKNSTTSGEGTGNGSANGTEVLAERPPLQKPPSHYILRTARTAPPGEPALTQEVVSSYNLDWKELRPFLIKKYPELKFVESQFGIEDHYVFDVPEKRPLTDEDRNKINEIRAQHRARKNPELKIPRREHSPDPPPRDGNGTK